MKLARLHDASVESGSRHPDELTLRLATSDFLGRPFLERWSLDVA